VHARAVSAGLCGDWDERRETFGADRQVGGNEEAKADERGQNLGKCGWRQGKMGQSCILSVLRPRRRDCGDLDALETLQTLIKALSAAGTIE
jgi:hypothetical protein